MIIKVTMLGGSYMDKKTGIKKGKIFKVISLAISAIVYIALAIIGCPPVQDIDN